MTQPLTVDRILDAAEGTLRRFGPHKATVLDVARALDVSHGSVYRHFASKQDLWDAVAARWLHRVAEPLADIAAAAAAPSADAQPASDRMVAWLCTLSQTKRRMAADDPEMFATYVGLAEAARGVIAAHVQTLERQLAEIIAAGVASGAFLVTDVHAAARAVFRATAPFHHPGHAGEWADPELDRAFQDVVTLLISGLSAQPKPITPPFPSMPASCRD